MSIYIAGMEMPKRRGTLVLIKTDGQAIVYEDEPYVTDAVYVPPHGDLIDADALINDLIFPTTAFERGFRELMNDTPTVIEADELVET